ncbi:unnamed protein product [Phytomonas sp. Hart1]|nr:unnamed protein product [Phytomonas sp. Hart1]|eukprot:CCW70406.1 unnamed protein product [Phytomonas sp. isolate Hart1]
MGLMREGAGEAAALANVVQAHYREALGLLRPLAEAVEQNAQDFNVVWTLWQGLLRGSDAAYEAERTGEARLTYGSLLVAFSRVAAGLDPRTRRQILQDLSSATTRNSRAGLHDSNTVREALVAALGACLSPAHAQTIFNQLSAPANRSFLDATDLAMGTMLQAPSRALDGALFFFSFALQRYRLSMNVVHALAARILLEGNENRAMGEAVKVVYTVLDTGVQSQRGRLDPQPERTFFLRMLSFYAALHNSTEENGENGPGGKSFLATEEQIHAAARVLREWISETTTGAYEGSSAQSIPPPTTSALTIRLLQSVWIFLFQHFEREAAENSHDDQNNPLFDTLRDVLKAMSRGLLQGSERLSHSLATAFTSSTHALSREICSSSCDPFLKSNFPICQHTSNHDKAGFKEDESRTSVNALSVRLLHFPDYFNAYDCLSAWGVDEIQTFLELVEQLLTGSDRITKGEDSQYWWIRLWDYCTLAELEAHLHRFTLGDDRRHRSPSNNAHDKGQRGRFFCPSGLRAATSKGTPLKVRVLDGLADTELALWLFRRQLHDQRRDGEVWQEANLMMVEVEEVMRGKGIQLPRSFSKPQEMLVRKWLREYYKESKLSEALLAPSSISDLQFFTRTLEQMFFEKASGGREYVESLETPNDVQTAEETPRTETTKEAHGLSNMFITL